MEIPGVQLELEQNLIISTITTFDTLSVARSLTANEKAIVVGHQPTIDYLTNSKLMVHGIHSASRALLASASAARTAPTLCLVFSDQLVRPGLASTFIHRDGSTRSVPTFELIHAVRHGFSLAIQREDSWKLFGIPRESKEEQLKLEEEVLLTLDDLLIDAGNGRSLLHDQLTALRTPAAYYAHAISLIQRYRTTLFSAAERNEITPEQRRVATRLLSHLDKQARRASSNA